MNPAQDSFPLDLSLQKKEAISLSIQEGILSYHVPENIYRTKDKTCEIREEDILVIGFVGRMDGDEDKEAIVLIDRLTQQYHITLGQIDDLGERDLKKWLKDRFGLKNMPSHTHDFDLVLFPEHLKGQNLYRHSLMNWLGRTFGTLHFASGKLSQQVLGLVGAFNQQNQYVCAVTQIWVESTQPA